MFCVYRSLVLLPSRKKSHFVPVDPSQLFDKKRSWKAWRTWCPEPRSSMLGSKRVAGGRPTSRALARGVPPRCGGRRELPGERPGDQRPCGGRPRRPELLAKNRKIWALLVFGEQLGVEKNMAFKGWKKQLAACCFFESESRPLVVMELKPRITWPDGYNYKPHEL